MNISSARAARHETEVVVRVEHVTKRFKLYKNIRTGLVKELLFPRRRSDFYKDFTAVSDVSLEVRRGEIVGIIGANGAGKTTLLKMIAGLLPLDEGRIEVNGRVTALLALGVGVHPEFSGRENVLYTGMLLGMRKQEVLTKMSEIIEFAEIRDFIEQPFRTYSSGMKARLLFSVAMSIAPEIVIVDEALATGDMSFVQKSQARIRQLCSSGATVLFVSHNLRQVAELCERSIVMQRGRIVYDGPTDEAAARYVEGVHAQRDLQLWQETEPPDLRRRPLGTGEIHVDDIYFTVDGRRTNTVVIGESCELHVEYSSSRALPSVQLCVEIRSAKSGVTYAFVPSTIPGLLSGRPESGSPFRVTAGKGRVTIAFSRLVMGDGDYSCDVEMFDGSPDFNFSYDRCYCYYQRILRFQAIYREPRYFSRGTMTEIPVDDVRTEVLV